MPKEYENQMTKAGCTEQAFAWFVFNIRGLFTQNCFRVAFLTPALTKSHHKSNVGNTGIGILAVNFLVKPTQIF